MYGLLGEQVVDVGERTPAAVGEAGRHRDAAERRREGTRRRKAETEDGDRNSGEKIGGTEQTGLRNLLALLSAAIGQRPRNYSSCCCSFPFVSFPH